jgi:hypothetical protein
MLALLATNAAAVEPQFIADVAFTDCQGLICVPVSVDGQSRTFVLDTGNVTGYIAEDAARALDWQAGPYIGRDGKPVPGLNSVGPHTLEIGPLRLEVPKMLVLPRQDFAPVEKPPFDGGLAFTALLDRVVQIDYPQHRLRISDRITGGFAATGGGELKRITFGHKGPPILTGGPFTINGQNLQAQIDTCYTGSLVIYDDAVGKLGLQSIAKKGEARKFPYTDGGVTMLGSRTRSVGFAGQQLDGADPVIYFATPGVHQPEGLFEATAGNELFRQTVLTLDLHDMRMKVDRSNG